MKSCPTLHASKLAVMLGALSKHPAAPSALWTCLVTVPGRPFCHVLFCTLPSACLPRSSDALLQDHVGLVLWYYRAAKIAPKSPQWPDTAFNLTIKNHKDDSKSLAIGKRPAIFSIHQVDSGCAGWNTWVVARLLHAVWCGGFRWTVETGAYIVTYALSQASSTCNATPL